MYPEVPLLVDNEKSLSKPSTIRPSCQLYPEARPNTPPVKSKVGVRSPKLAVCLLCPTFNPVSTPKYQPVQLWEASIGAPTEAGPRDGRSAACAELTPAIAARPTHPAKTLFILFPPIIPRTDSSRKDSGSRG